MAVQPYSGFIHNQGYAQITTDKHIRKNLPYPTFPTIFRLLHTFLRVKRLIQPAGLRHGFSLAALDCTLDCALNALLFEHMLLCLEHLEVVNEGSFKSNLLNLLEEVDVGCIGKSHGPDRIQMGRAVTMPAGVDENNVAAFLVSLCGLGNKSFRIGSKRALAICDVQQICFYIFRVNRAAT